MYIYICITLPKYITVEAIDYVYLYQIRLSKNLITTYNNTHS